MQLFLGAYSDLQALRAAQAVNVDAKVKNLLREINEEKHATVILEQEISYLSSKLRRKLQNGAIVQKPKKPPQTVYSSVRTPSLHSKASTFRASSQTPSLRASIKPVETIQEKPRSESRRSNPSGGEKHRRLFQSMYTKDYIPKKNFDERILIHGRPKDDVWEYREQLLKDQHVIRGLYA